MCKFTECMSVLFTFNSPLLFSQGNFLVTINIEHGHTLDTVTIIITITIKGCRVYIVSGDYLLAKPCHYSKIFDPSTKQNPVVQ